MKCPKCGYLGFETGDRCRNCGYDFSLLAGFDLPDLAIHNGPEDAGPLPDLTFERTPDEAAGPPAPTLPPFRPPVAPLAPPAPPARAAGERRAGAPAIVAGGSAPVPEALRPVPPPRLAPVEPLPVAPRPPAEDPGEAAALRRAADERSARIAANAAARLPLFPGAQDVDARLLTPPVRPRPPLAVRRATPEVPRFRAEPRPAPAIDFDPPAASPPADQDARPQPRPAPAGAAEAPAGLGRRLLAGLFDVALLAGLDLVVLAFTLEICGLSFHQLATLPVIPIAGFLALLDGSYFVAFTTGGQTIGKMAAGLRVVGEDDQPVTIGRATLRVLIWALSALPLGLGFLSIVASRDRAALHDRFARTRVVTVSSR